MIRRPWLLLAVVLYAQTPLAAQVGYDPRRSPYRDLVQTQEVTVFSGYYRAKRDAANVAPQSGPLVGVLYQWRPGGPANINFSAARLASQRRVLDPEAPATCPAGGDCKLIGTFRWPVYFFDAGLALALTGARSFYHIVPEAKLGAGVVSDFRTQADVGGFAFGTRFAFNWGVGLRWVPGEGEGTAPIQLRADLVNHLYNLRYPLAYYQPAPDNSTIFTRRQSRSAWLNNPAITIGFSYLFSR